MALAGIDTLEAANRWIADTYLAAHNARFAVEPEEAGTAFVPDRGGAAGETLCIQEERRVGNDNTLKWRRLTLQIPPSPLRPHFVRATVRVHEYPDGRVWRSFTDRTGWPITIPKETYAMTRNWLREPLRQPAPAFAAAGPVDLWITLRVPHNPTGPTTTTEAVN